MNIEVFNQMAKTLPQISQSHWFQPNDNQNITKNMEEITKMTYQQHTSSQFPSTNSNSYSNNFLNLISVNKTELVRKPFDTQGMSQNYTPNAGSVNNGNHLALESKHLLEAMTTNQRSILLQQVERDIIPETALDKLHRSRDYFTSRNSNENEESKHSTNQPLFGMELAYTITESDPKKFAASMDFQNLVRGISISEENFQLSRPHETHNMPSLSKTNSFLETIVRGPFARVQHASPQNRNEMGSFLNPEYNQVGISENQNNSQTQHSAGIKPKEQENEIFHELRETGNEFGHFMSESTRQDHMNQYLHYDTAQGNLRNDYSEPSQRNIQDYTLQ